ncbi:MAG: hypothetical protein GC160_03920 [Acidobacteria bacterium]|nr:hypothetical protein [Acidobacteriota bacterium]
MVHRRQHYRPRSLFLELLDRFIGRGQTLISAGERLPLVLASYPRGRFWFVQTLQSALQVTFPSLPASLRAAYAETLGMLPSVVVADLRRRNVCSCLGHHHPSLALSPLARRLASEMGGRVGEIDLAVESIRAWAPLPLSSLAAEQFVPPADADSRRTYEQVRFHAALLSVFLHELEHLAFPQRAEQEIRRRSDEFYQAALRHQLAAEFGASFGISAYEDLVAQA